MRHALLIFGIVSVVGCNSAPPELLTNPGPAVLQSGWTLAESAEDGVSIGVPGGWKHGVDTIFGMAGMPEMPSDMQLGDSNLQGFLDQARNDAKEEEQRELADLRKKGIIINVILAGARPTIGEERTRFYVKKIDHGGNYPLKEAALDEAEFLMGEGPAKEINLPVGKAVEYVANVTTQGGDKVDRISYVLQNGPTTYVIRFISTNDPTAIQSIAKQVAETFRVSTKS